jgi:hypothetical protein
MGCPGMAAVPSGSRPPTWMVTRASAVRSPPMACSSAHPRSSPAARRSGEQAMADSSSDAASAEHDSRRRPVPHRVQCSRGRLGPAIWDRLPIRQESAVHRDPRLGSRAASSWPTCTSAGAGAPGRQLRPWGGPRVAHRGLQGQWLPPPGPTPDLIGVGPHAAATLGPPRVRGLPPWVRWAPRSTPCLRGDSGAL